MFAHDRADITELAIVGEQFPLRLKQLGFRLMQVIDEQKRDLLRYIAPPVCEVPAGPFLMGSDKQRDPNAEDDELPQHEVMVPAFRIGMFPLTVAEYACAVAAGGVHMPGSDGAVTWQTQQQHPDHPIVCLSWHQANAYATWLADVTRQPWRLPTEVEWEKAARGTDGRIYPWGDEFDTERANIGLSAGMPTPVGTYAGNGDASPYGVHDMAGNVWEWTTGIFEPERLLSPYRSDDVADSAAIRIARGGSWFNIPRNARAACRSALQPDGVSHDYGMRLALNATAEA